MPGETDLHKTLKKEACRWLFRMGYRCIAAEVRLKPLGIIDAVGTGLFRPYHNYLFIPRDLPQVCFIECKASRERFPARLQRRRADVALPDGAQAQPHSEARKQPATSAAPGGGAGEIRGLPAAADGEPALRAGAAGIIQKKDLPPRWGLLTYGEGGINVVVRSDWQETGRIEYVESAIARTLTGDIYRADDRAINSVNREIFTQQQRWPSGSAR